MSGVVVYNPVKCVQSVRARPLPIPCPADAIGQCPYDGPVCKTHSSYSPVGPRACDKCGEPLQPLPM